MFKPRVLALCLAGAASACHGGSHPSTGAGSLGARKHDAAAAGPTIAAQTEGMVEAPGSHKSTVQVSLKFALSQAPALGTPLAIDLAVIPRITADSATVTVSPSPAFGVAPSGSTATWTPVDPSKAYRTRVTVTPAEEGVVELDVAVSLQHDGISEVRGFSLPLIVGAAK